MRRSHLLVVVGVLVIISGAAVAQEAATVPDLTGLNVPEAAAALNRIGLALGQETNEGWTAESGLEQNTIRAQSVPAGQSLALHQAVDVTVLRSPNAALIYDDNDLTLVNQTGAELNLGGIGFNTLDGTPAALSGARWSPALRSGQCVQVWSVGRNGPKGLDECEAIQNWFVTTNSAEQFWTGAGGTTQFVITQNGVPRAACAVANPGRCDFYLAAVTAGDSTDYVYFAYTADRLAIINRSDDRWMVLNGFTLYNFNVPQQGGLALNVADPSLYGANVNPVARLGQLAPGQCIFFTNAAPDSQEPPEDCDVIARFDMGASIIFWGVAFELDSVSDGRRRSCPAATDGRLTICVMPR